MGKAAIVGGTLVVLAIIIGLVIMWTRALASTPAYNQESFARAQAKTRPIPNMQSPGPWPMHRHIPSGPSPGPTERPGSTTSPWRRGLGRRNRGPRVPTGG